MPAAVHAHFGRIGRPIISSPRTRSTTLDVTVVAMVGGLAAIGSVNGYQCPVLQRGRSGRDRRARFDGAPSGCDGREPSLYDGTVDDTWQKDLTWVEVKLSLRLTIAGR